MMTENDIVNKLSAHLETEGYEIIQSLSTGERGVDIIARKNGQTLYIEAKGETSSKSHTKRYGKPFTSNQIKTHVSRAIIAAMKNLASELEGENTKNAIALPDTKGHRDFIDEIYPAFKKLDILIYWVSQHSIKQV